MFKYKIDVLEALKGAGYSTYRLRADKLIGCQAITDIKAGKVVGIIALETICRLLDCQPGDIIEYVKGE